MEPHFFQVNVRWSTNRKGLMCSPELDNPSENGCIEVATPPQFPKGIPGIWSPEHLFTASVASCFMTTFLAIAENSRLEFISFSCPSKGKLEKVNGKLEMTEVILEPLVTIASSENRDKAMRILQKTEPACLISNSIKARVVMNPTVRLHEENPA